MNALLCRNFFGVSNLICNIDHSASINRLTPFILDSLLQVFLGTRVSFSKIAIFAGNNVGYKIVTSLSATLVCDIFLSDKYSAFTN